MFKAPIPPKYAKVLTPEAIAFLVRLQRAHNARRKELLAARVTRQAALDARQQKPGLPPREPRHIRNSDWTVAPLPADLLDRRAEITGPVDRKMIINALNSGAKVYMADFEDSTTPTWDNLLDGQPPNSASTPFAAPSPTKTPPTKKSYKLIDSPAVLFVRARGAGTLEERHMIVDGEPMSGSLFDFGLYAFHNARELPRPRLRPLLLPAQDGVAPRSPASGTTSSSRPEAEELGIPAQKLHQGHRPHRDHPRLF